MAAAGMAMASAAAQSRSGGTKANLDPCTAGFARSTDGRPRECKGGMRITIIIITGIFTPIHIGQLGMAMLTYGLVVWGRTPRGTAASSSPGSEVAKPGPASTTVTEMSDGQLEDLPTRGGDQQRTRARTSATCSMKSSPALTSPPPSWVRRA